MCDKKYVNNKRKNFVKNVTHNLPKCADTLGTFLPNKLTT